MTDEKKDDQALTAFREHIIKTSGEAGVTVVGDAIAVMLGNPIWFWARQSSRVTAAVRDQEPFKRLLGPLCKSHALAERAARECVAQCASGLAYGFVRDVIAPGIVGAPGFTGDAEPACERLASVVHEHIKVIEATIGECPSTENEQPPIKSNILALDECFAEYVAGVGTEGEHAAKRIREDAGERMRSYTGEQTSFEGLEPGPGGLWKLWINLSFTRPPFFLEALTQVLWVDDVRPQLERLREKPAALIMPVMETFTRVHSHGVVVQKDKENQLALFDQAGNLLINVELPRIPTMDIGAAQELFSKGARALGTLNAYRLLDWEVVSGWQRAMKEKKDARVLTVVGGWTGLAEKVGAAGGKAIGELKALLHIQQQGLWPFLGADAHGLLTYTIHKASGRQPSKLVITLGDMLMPGAVHDIAKRLSDERQLVPIVELPPMIGRDRDKGAQANLSKRVVIQMRWDARDLVTYGGVLLKPETLEKMAAAAGVTPGILKKVMLRWIREGDDGPAFLEKVDRNRYTLGEHHAVARKYLEGAGERELRNVEAGKKSGARRKRKWRRRVAE